MEIHMYHFFLMISINCNELTILKILELVITIVYICILYVMIHIEVQYVKLKQVKCYMLS